MKGGLRAALKLCVTYPDAACCFFAQTIIVTFKIWWLCWAVAGVFERGFFTSILIVVFGFFAIDLLGPKGIKKTIAVEFGKRFWTTLVPR